MKYRPERSVSPEAIGEGREICNRLASVFDRKKPPPKVLAACERWAFNGTQHGEASNQTSVTPKGVCSSYSAQPGPRPRHHWSFPRAGNCRLPLLRGIILAGCPAECLDDPGRHGTGG